jgi:hypothetical protein
VLSTRLKICVVREVCGPTTSTTKTVEPTTIARSRATGRSVTTTFRSYACPSLGTRRLEVRHTRMTEDGSAFAFGVRFVSLAPILRERVYHEVGVHRDSNRLRGD